MDRRIVLAAVAAAAVAVGIAAVAGIGDREFVRNDSDRLAVAASFYPIYEFARAVAGERADVSPLVPAGAEPHDWEPTARQLQEIGMLDIVAINGAGFEEWVDPLVEEGYSGIVVDTSEGIELMDGDGGADPHIWLSPTKAAAQVGNIGEALAAADPGNADYYRANAGAYAAELGALDAEIREGLEGCSRDFISTHDAFSYFADEYGLVQHSVIPSNDPHAHATAGSIEDVVSEARELGIRVVFAEDTEDPGMAAVVADEIGAEVMTLSPLEISTGDTYLGAMYKNLESLRAALC